MISAAADDFLAALARADGRLLALDVGTDLVEVLTQERPDAAFVALHGPGGEDGTVQELLEILEVPYTGPGVAACIRCMDKVLAKHEMRGAGIPTPDFVAFYDTAKKSDGDTDYEELKAGEKYDLKERKKVEK